MLNGEYLISRSPCGLNCSYAIQFDGPDFSCGEGNWSGLENRTFEFYGDFSSYRNEQEARPEYSPPANFLGAPSRRGDKYYFDVQYGEGGMENMTCTYFASTYHGNVTFINGTQTIEVEAVRKYALNATALSYPYLFAPYEVVPSADKDDTAAFEKPFSDDTILATPGRPDSPNITVSDAYHDSNIRAIADAVAFTLGGAISKAGTDSTNAVKGEFDADIISGKEGEFVGNTLVVQTPWVPTTKAWLGTTYDFTQLTPSLYEEMLRNVTISMLARPNTNTTASVTKSPWENAYKFARKESLIWAYGVSLVVSAGFIIFGIVALFQNGVPAESGGFLQVLCTTTGDNLAINREAAACSMGGSSNFSNELKELRVRYGYIKATEGDESKPRAGFGTREEMDAI